MHWRMHLKSSKQIWVVENGDVCDFDVSFEQHKEDPKPMKKNQRCVCFVECIETKVGDFDQI